VKAGPSPRVRALEGKRPRRAARSVFSLNRWTGWRTLARSKTLKAYETPRGERRRRRRTAAREEESSGGWPQERIRHETRPAGSGRMKAPGGCENLKAQAVGRGRSNHSCRCSGRGNAEGVETSREALQNGARVTPGVGTLGNQGLYAAARCLGIL